MLGGLIVLAIAAIVGFRRGAIDAKAIAVMVSVSLFLVVIIVVGNAAFMPLAPTPNIIAILIAFLGYFVPMFAGYAIGATAKKRRVANDAEDHGQE